MIPVIGGELAYFTECPIIRLLYTYCMLYVRTLSRHEEKESRAKDRLGEKQCQLEKREGGEIGKERQFECLFNIEVIIDRYRQYH